jgi:hypothetical protein
VLQCATLCCVMCCSTLQCGMCYSALQCCTAVQSGITVWQYQKRGETHQGRRVWHPGLQHSVAVCCSVLQCVAARCSVLQCSVEALCCSVMCKLQCAAVLRCSTRRKERDIREEVADIPCCSALLQRVAVCCSVLQCAAVCYRTEREQRHIGEGESGILCCKTGV